jgi:hypothetical protein
VPHADDDGDDQSFTSQSPAWSAASFHGTFSWKTEPAAGALVEGCVGELAEHGHVGGRRDGWGGVAPVEQVAAGGRITFAGLAHAGRTRTLKDGDADRGGRANQHWLLVRRNQHTGELAFYRCFMPHAVPLAPSRSSTAHAASWCRAVPAPGEENNRNRRSLPLRYSSASGSSWSVVNPSLSPRTRPAP